MGCKPSTASTKPVGEGPGSKGGAPPVGGDPSPKPGSPNDVRVLSSSSPGGDRCTGMPNLVVHGVPTSQTNGDTQEGPPLDEGKVTPLSSATSEGPDVVGTDCTPPPGGREGGVLKIGAPPSNILEIPGEPCEKGRVKRPPVALNGGTTYEGTWKGMVIDGHGTLTAPNGTTYTGQFVDGKLEGQGSWFDATGAKYEGQWKAGRVDGKGRLTHEDGSAYDGQFKMDVKEGKGVETWADGTIFEGEFKEGEKTGKGKIRFADGSTYEGSFKNDLFDGKGTYIWANKRKYEGQWKEGMMNGSGVYTWPSGQFSKYEGEFVDGIKQGKGKLFVRDGRRYIGEWKKNKLDGNIAEVMPSGRKRIGIWKEGVFQRWVDAAEKVTLDVREKDTDKDEEFATSIFSNPDAYTQVYKTKDRKRIKVKGGVLRSKAKDGDESSEVEEAGAEAAEAPEKTNG